MSEKEPGQAYCEWEATEWAAAEKAIRADERAKVIEECAGLAEAMPKMRAISNAHVRGTSPQDVAAAIRAKGASNANG